MKEETFAPFRGRYTRRGFHPGVTTSDSVVVRIYDPFAGSEQKKPVLKWNRRLFASSEETLQAAIFVNKSLALYKLVLGEEFIVPTHVVMGAKQDGRKYKYKVYLIQPYVDGWNGKTLPPETRKNSYLVDQWRTLYHRLSWLYNTAQSVNEYLTSDSLHAFPITLTVGDSRERAKDYRDCADILPATPNVLIDRHTLQLSLCDFGRYTPWQDEMEETYTQIRAKT